MGICTQELKRWVIQPTLQRLNINNKAAVRLLLGTAAQESAMGSHLKASGQKGSGIYQIHGLTHRHIWDDYLAMHPDIASLVRGLASQRDFLDHPHAELTTNLSYATAIAWFNYARHPEFCLPGNADLNTLARLSKRFYHPKGDVSCEHFINNYRLLVDGVDNVA